jgi:transcriptional regulator with XRE-family HTH domain
LSSAFAVLKKIAMATRRWVGELEAWMRTQGLSKEEVAKRSSRSTQHVLALFEQREPNPTLKLYLDVVDAAGARIKGVGDNTPAALIARLRELREREGISTSALSRASGVRRPQLSTLFNSPDPNPKLAMVDAIVSALGVEGDITMVACVSPDIEYAIAIGEGAQQRVQATQEAANSAHRHLEIVESIAPAMGHAEAEKRIALLRNKVDIAEQDLARAKEQCRRQQETIEKLKRDNLALEKQRADDAAKWRRVLDENKLVAQEREAKQNARIRELESRPQWSTLEVAGVGLAGAAVGVGLLAVLQKLRS